MIGELKSNNGISNQFMAYSSKWVAEMLQSSLYEEDNDDAFKQRASLSLPGWMLPTCRIEGAAEIFRTRKGEHPCSSYHN